MDCHRNTGRRAHRPGNHTGSGTEHGNERCRRFAAYGHRDARPYRLAPNPRTPGSDFRSFPRPLCRGRPSGFCRNPAANGSRRSVRFRRWVGRRWRSRRQPGTSGCRFHRSTVPNRRRAGDGPKHRRRSAALPRGNACRGRHRARHRVLASPSVSGADRCARPSPLEGEVGNAPALPGGGCDAACAMSPMTCLPMGCCARFLVRSALPPTQPPPQGGRGSKRCVNTVARMATLPGDWQGYTLRRRGGT
jgi:hypothetical protein